MEVNVEFQGKKYIYTQVGNIMTWTDEKKMVVPVMLHRLLREEAISSGTDVGVFISEKEEPKPLKTEKKVVSIRSKKKTLLKGGFNPFNQ
jgi:hypothetical protein